MYRCAVENPASETCECPVRAVNEAGVENRLAKPASAVVQ
jgi:hypothetical protein